MPKWAMETGGAPAAHGSASTHKHAYTHITYKDKKLNIIKIPQQPSTERKQTRDYIKLEKMRNDW